MIGAVQIREWLDTLEPGSGVAVDDGGLSLVEINEAGEETGAYIEVGGIPEDE